MSYLERTKGRESTLARIRRSAPPYMLYQPLGNSVMTQKHGETKRGVVSIIYDICIGSMS